MKLRELQNVVYPVQNVKILYRDPTHSLQTSILFEGWFKKITDNILLDRNVAVTRCICSVMYIEVY